MGYLWNHIKPSFEFWYLSGSKPFKKFVPFFILFFISSSFLRASVTRSFSSLDMYDKNDSRIRSFLITSLSNSTVETKTLHLYSKIKVL